MHTVIRKIKLGTDFFAQDRPESVSDTSLRYFLSLEPVWSELDAPTAAREPRSSYFARVGFIMRAPTVVRIFTKLDIILYTSDEVYGARSDDH